MDGHGCFFWGLPNIKHFFHKLVTCELTGKLFDLVEAEKGEEVPIDVQKSQAKIED